MLLRMCFNDEPFSLSLNRNYSSPETEGHLLNSLVQYLGDSLGTNVKTMPSLEETTLPEDPPLTLPMVIIGELFLESFSSHVTKKLNNTLI